MKVFLDDIRNAPDNTWNVVRNYDAVIALIDTGMVTEISLDHDLGTIETGYDVALYIERKVWVDGFYPPIIYVHSANPVGRARIEAAIASIQRGITFHH